MALQRRSGQIPEGAVRLSESEAFAHQMELISKHKPESDMWIFKYGSSISVLCSGLPAIFLQQHYRRKLKLMNYGRMSTLIPTVFFSTAVATLVHMGAVQKEIVLLKSHCPICIYTKSGLLQAGIGVGTPLVLAPVAGFMVAMQHFTYPVPPANELRKVAQLWWKFTRPLSPQLAVLFFSQFALGVALAHFETNALFTMYEKAQQNPS